MTALCLLIEFTGVDLVLLKHGMMKPQRNALYWMDLCCILNPELPRDLIDSGRNKYTKSSTREVSRKSVGNLYQVQ